jgi:hypothetical protein
MIFLDSHFEEYLNILFQEMYKYMVKHHKKPAQRDIVNNENLTPLALASKLGRHRLFKEILELNSIVSIYK